MALITAYPAETMPRVFLVEGDLAVRLSLVWLLESHGIQVSAFASAGEFLECVEDGDDTRGCLMLDIGLRGVDRLLRFTGEMRARHLAVPLVAMSADPFVSADDVQRAGAAAFLSKPFASDALLDSLRTACDPTAIH